jgi:hypothetical protein
MNLLEFLIVWNASNLMAAGLQGIVHQCGHTMTDAIADWKLSITW